MLHFIVNANSGKRNGRKYADAAAAYCLRHGVEYAMYFTQAAGDGEKIAARITADEPAASLVAVGGDGTFHEVLNGLAAPAESTLGFLPAGRGNDFARAADLPKSVSASLGRILRGETKNIDYIECDGRRCLNVAGTGLDVDVLERVAGKNGKLKYLISLVYCLKHFEPYRVSVTAAGETREYDCIMAGVCNGISIGGGIKLSPVSKIDDGKLDIIVMQMPANGRIMPVLPKFVKGKHMHLPITTHIVCEEAEIVCRNGKPIQLDGEIYRDKRLLCKVARGGLKIFA